MRGPIQTLIEAGSKVWLDSIDPEAVSMNIDWGVTGATSNPSIIAELVATGRFDDQLAVLLGQGMSDEDTAWGLTDGLVELAERSFRPAWDRTRGNDGYVSFELDPLIEDPERNLPHQERVRRYLELGQHYARQHLNRLIKVPATCAGLDALEELAAAGVNLNVTLCFTRRQYELAREAVWRGSQRRPDVDDFKSVYSIFVSRVDQYTRKHLPQLSPAAQGQVGIVNAKEVWTLNEEFWADKGLRLQQEIVFASTGVKHAGEPADKYVEALAGGGILTNPPATNEAVQASGKTYVARVKEMPPAGVVEEIRREVDMNQLEATLLREGVTKFARPQQELLQRIGERREAMRGRQVA